MTQMQRYVEVPPELVTSALWRSVHDARTFAEADLGLDGLRYRFFKKNTTTAETDLEFAGGGDLIGLCRECDNPAGARPFVWVKSDLEPSRGAEIMLHEARHVYQRVQGWQRVRWEADARAYATQGLRALDPWRRGDTLNAHGMTSKACLAPLPEPRTYTRPAPAAVVTAKRPTSAPRTPPARGKASGFATHDSFGRRVPAGMRWVTAAELRDPGSWVNVGLRAVAENLADAKRRQLR